MNNRNQMNNRQLALNSPIQQGRDRNTAPVTDPGQQSGLVKIKIDREVFKVLLRKRRARETVRMALERAILQL
jgi:hypothetical protein